MRSILRLSFAGDGAARLRDVGQLLTQLCASRIAVPGMVWQVTTPGWLDTQFAGEQTEQERTLWMAEWRRSSPERRDVMAQEREWGRAEWLYWFSPENVFWQIVEVDVDPESSEIAVHLAHDDEPFPVEALLWLASAAQATAGDVQRVK